jgi:uncharacterized repeat protein (TIGR03847 family)
MSRSFELPEADWATVGTVGEPGQRTFYLQARQEDQLLTLKLEKQQVAALAHFLGEVLADLPVVEGETPATALMEPVLAEWPVGTMQLSYDNVADRVVIMAEEIGPPSEEEAGEDPDLRGDVDLGVARIGITRTTAAAIVRVGAELVEAGRPICGLCGRPMDPEGHSCPKTNGHKPN